MRAPLFRVLAGGILAAAVAAGCGEAQTNLDDLVPTPVPLPAGAIPVPVDAHLVRPGLCSMPAAVPRLEGTLEADAANADWPVWLRAPDGHRMYVRWPAGFSVRFGATAELLDDQGVVALTAGQAFRLPQVRVGELLGTMGDPYLARGQWEQGGRCYAIRA